MQNFISTFSPSKSFQFVNEQLCRQQGSPRRHDCHSPPHALAWDFTMTDPRREDWLRLRGRPLESTTVRWDFARTQRGGEDCPGLWSQTSGTTAGARITC